MNSSDDITLDSEGQPAESKPRTILYFRFGPDMGSVIEQVEYDLLQTNLSQH